jgi:hypothetical protein
VVLLVDLVDFLLVGLVADIVTLEEREGRGDRQSSLIDEKFG